MSRAELDSLVASARDARKEYSAALRTNKLEVITPAAGKYHTAFDALKNTTKWSLTKLFDVVNEGKDY
jgi:hypothetical protein